MLKILLTSCTSRKYGRCDRRRSPARVAATAGLVAGQCPINEDSLTWLPRTSSPIQSSPTYHHHHQPQPRGILPQDARLKMKDNNEHQVHQNFRFKQFPHSTKHILWWPFDSYQQLAPLTVISRLPFHVIHL